jgi:adenylate kinase
VSCDKCGTELSVRRDDAPEVVESRLAVYHETTEPLKDYYEKLGILKTVIGQGSVDETSKLVKNAIGV